MNSSQDQPTQKENAMLNAWKALRGHTNKGQKKRMVLIGFLILVSAGMDVCGLGMILPLIKFATEPGQIGQYYYTALIYEKLHFANEKSFLFFMIMAVLVFFLCKSIFGLLVNFLQTRFTADVASFISRNQFSKYYSLNFYDFSNINSSLIINHVLRNPTSFVEFVLLPMIMLFSESVIVLMIIGAIAVYNITLFSFILLTVGPATFLIYYAIRTKNQKIGKGIDENYPLALSALTHSIMGYIDIKLANKEEHYRKRFMGFQHKLNHLTMTSYLLNMIPLRANEVVALLGMVVIFIYSIFISDNQSNVIVLVGAFAAASYRVMPSMNRILNSLLFIKKNQVSIENLNMFNDLYKREKAINTNVPIHFTKEIEFSQVSFRFPNSRFQILKNISLVVGKGEKVGFVGTSGSGKTTLMNLILRFYEEESGSILIDGVPLKKENTSYWRSLIGYVKQDIFLLDASIRENIAFGEDVIDEERLRLAIKHASLEQLVESLPMGWNTPVGEKGSRLSGGQRQRIGIARSLYRNAEILIFDEATSALDNETETSVTESIDALSHSNKTIFIIAHRITTLKNCDRIYELKNGEINGVYSYNELLEKVV